MADVVRVNENSIAWSLSQEELEVLTESIKVVLSELSDGDLHPRTGAERLYLEDLLGYLELVKWRAYGAQEFDESLAPYLKNNS